MPEQASLRSGLLLGLLLSLAVLACVWFGLRGKNPETGVALLVRCDVIDVHRIVNRLRDMDVEVVEAGTMKRLPPSDAMRETPPPAPLASAFEVTEHVLEIAAAGQHDVAVVHTRLHPAGGDQAVSPRVSRIAREGGAAIAAVA